MQQFRKNKHRKNHKNVAKLFSGWEQLKEFEPLLEASGTEIPEASVWAQESILVIVLFKFSGIPRKATRVWYGM